MNKENVIKYFETAINEGKRKEKNVLESIAGLVSLGEGIKNYEALNTRYPKLKRPISRRNLLMASLIKTIPKDADLIEEAIPKLEGLMFVDTLALYTKEIREKIKEVLLPQQIDIDKEMIYSRMATKKLCLYGISLQSNCDIYLRNSLASSIQEKEKSDVLNVWQSHFYKDKVGQDISLKHENYSPLIDMYSGEDLIQQSKCDVRLLLKIILDYDFSKVDTVFLSYRGVFVEEEGEMKLIKATKKYKNLFFNKNKDLNDLKKKNEKVNFASETNKKFAEKLRTVILDVIDDKMAKEFDRLSWYEQYVEKIRKSFGASFYVKNDVPSSFVNEKNIKVLFDFLLSVKSVIPAYFVMIYLNTEGLSEEEINDEGKIKMRLRAFHRFLMMPNNFKKYMLKEHSLNISMEDMLALEKYPKAYKPVLYSKLLMQVCRKISSNNGFKNCYTELVQCFGERLITQFQKGFKERGFLMNTDLMDQAVFLQLFTRFGVMFLMEVEQDKVSEKLSDEMRIFFRKYLKMGRTIKISHKTSQD